MKRILLILLLAIPMVAQQQPGQPGPHPRNVEGRGFSERGAGMHGKWWNNTELAKKLNLTDQQVTQMEQIFQQSRVQLIDKRAAVEKAEVALQPLMEADRPDESQVLAQIDKVAQARADLEKTNARMLLGIRQVLNADQWKQLKTEMPRPGMGMRRRGGEGGEMRPRRRGPEGGPNAPPLPPPPPQDE